MYRRVLLIAALVCSLWIAAIAVPPGLADDSKATPDQYESGERFSTSNDTDEPDDSTGSEDKNETDGSDGGNETEERRWSGDSRWGDSEETEESNQDNESGDSRWGDDSGNESGEVNKSDDQRGGESGEPDEADEGTEQNESDDRNGYDNLTDAMMTATDGSVTLVEDAAGGSADVGSEARNDDTRVGLDVNHDSRVDSRYGDLVGENAPVAGVMTLPLSSVLEGLYPDAAFFNPATGLDPDVGTAEAIGGGAAEPSTGSADAEGSDDATTGSAESAASVMDGQPFGGEVPDGAGEGAALFLFVGYLGGHKLLASQTSLLAALREASRFGLGDPGLPLVPPLFGYSRHDESDPLNNDTRANIYDVVMESPGVYYAQLAEETDVTEETVRYHSRILADEGLVERRKIRGRKRLYPVSMEGESPELAAAMADSAASDVISAIEHREPATLSAVADAIDCAPSTVSYHLDRLEEDGLISRERDGSAVRIKLRRPTRTALEGGMADD
jgi:DNA-binding transcriptional ArsR family regulator